jgi:integrase
MATRTRRRRFDDRAVERLKPKAKRYSKPDSEMIGHYVRVMPSGVKSYCAVARDPDGKQIWNTIGTSDHLGIDEARAKAREIIDRIKRGLSPLAPPPPAPDSFAQVAENWLRRRVQQRGLRSEHEIRRCLNKYVLPRWGAIPFRSIRRGDTAKLLDFIEDNHGPRQADAVFTVLNTICNWFAARDDDFMPFTRRGMKRAVNHPRQRTLTDDEIRIVWQVAEKSGVFGSLLQFALLCGQRKDVLFGMKWSDIDANGVWSIPREPREKGNAGQIQLPELALTILRRLPHVDGSNLVFSPARGAGKMSTSSGMDRIRHALPEDFPRFAVHDLRRTFRTLASRVGVPSEISERLLGHVVGSSIEQTYDRHPYSVEKTHALEKVARLIEEIVSGPPSDKVVPFKAARS